MTAIIDSLDEVTPAWCSAVLGREVRTASPTLMGMGQFGLVAQVALTAADGAASSVIVKLPREDAGSRGVGTAMGMYEAEVRLYRDIAPTVAVRTPALHHGEVDPATGRFTLVLEDLSAYGTVGDMLAGVTIDQAAGALQALVDLQAPRWSDPTLHQHGWLADPQRSAVLFGGVPAALEPFLDRYGDRLDAEHVALVERVAPHATDWSAAMHDGPTVVLHGDFRADNLVFPSIDGAPVAVFDWQAVRLGPPLVDACVLLGGCLSREQRRAAEEDLVREHHAALVAHGVTGFDWDDCWRAYRWGVFWGLLLAVPMSLALERTDRGDELFAGMLRSYADMAIDLDSEALLVPA